METEMERARARPWPETAFAMGTAGGDAHATPGCMEPDVDDTEGNDVAAIAAREVVQPCVAVAAAASVCDSGGGDRSALPPSPSP